MKQKLRKALAHLRKVKSPPTHKKDVVRDGVVVYEAGSLDRGNQGTMQAFSLLRKIAIIKRKMAVNREDPGHVLDVAHASALVAHTAFLHQEMLDKAHASALVLFEAWTLHVEELAAAA